MSTPKDADLEAARQMVVEFAALYDTDLGEGRPHHTEALACCVDALREARLEGERAGLEDAARLCDKRAKQQKSAASDLAEHYGSEADEEASMCDADAIGAEALARSIRALKEEKGHDG